MPRRRGCRPRPRVPRTVRWPGSGARAARRPRSRRRVRRRARSRPRARSRRRPRRRSPEGKAAGASVKRTRSPATRRSSYHPGHGSRGRHATGPHGPRARPGGPVLARADRDRAAARHRGRRRALRRPARRPERVGACPRRVRASCGARRSRHDRPFRAAGLRARHDGRARGDRAPGALRARAPARPPLRRELLLGAGRDARRDRVAAARRHARAPRPLRGAAARVPRLPRRVGRRDPRRHRRRRDLAPRGRGALDRPARARARPRPT